MIVPSWCPHLAVAEPHRRAGRALDFQAHHAREILPEIKHVHAGLRLGHAVRGRVPA